MDLLQRLLYAALGSTALFYFIVKYSLKYWKHRGILHEKPKFLWGNLKGVGGKRHIATVLQDIYAKHKEKAPFVGCFALLKPLVFILDKNLLERVLNSQASKHFMHRGLYYNMQEDTMSRNLMQLDGECYAVLKNKCQAAYAEDKLQQLLPSLLHVATNFEKALKSKTSNNITHLVKSLNQDIVAFMCFGLESNSLQNSKTEFQQNICSFYKHSSVLKAYLAWSFPNVARLLQYCTYNEEAGEYFVKQITDRLKSRACLRTPPEQADFVQFFADLRKGSAGLDNKEIAAQCFSFVLIGLDACNSTLAFCLYELALQPELQQKVQEEIHKTLHKHSQTLSWECLQEMTYLKQVLQETLRKHPPYPLLLRRTTQDFEVPNSIFLLKKDNELVIPVYAIHHDAEYYAQPEKFDPERFAANNLSKIPKIAFLPFGEGPRSCIAQKYAELQMLVSLVTLLKQYSFSPCPETVIPLQYDNKKLMLSSKKDIQLQMKAL